MSAELVWDAEDVTSFVDATCSVVGVEIDTGALDGHSLYPAASAQLTLDNSDGKWSRFKSDGTQTNFGPGYPLSVWAVCRDDGSSWWLFDGTVTRWDETANGTVEVEAFDDFAQLAQHVGTFTAGVNGDKPGARMQAVLTVTGTNGIPHRFVTGIATLTAQSNADSGHTPLEELQVVASSDGEILFVDADGTLVSFDRNWRAGRTDQTAIPVCAYNVCTADVVVWDAVLSTNDEGLADSVVLENLAGLRAVSPSGALGRFVWTETDQQWTTQAEGDSLAGQIATAQASPARLNVESFDLYLLDPDQPRLAHAVEWRRLDVLRFLHNTKAPGNVDVRVDLNTIVVSISHSISPDAGWLMTVATSRAVGSNAIPVWNPAGDPYVWDTPGTVWGYQ